MKKTLFISAFSLDVGGIETALIALLKNLNNEYDITLALEKKQGIFLKDVPENVNVIEYKISNKKNVITRKIENFKKQRKFKKEYGNKFDYSISYATYSKPCSFLARSASKNAILWVHNNYLEFFGDNVNAYKKFFKELKINEFKKIVFVSEVDKNIFNAIMLKKAEKCVVCNNLIDYEEIIKKSNEQIDDFVKRDVPTFINIARQDENQKKISRIINSTKRLNSEGYKFDVLLVGIGSSTKNYKELAKNALNIKFLGVKKNPYPYLKLSDCFLLSSQYEGYPVTLVEALILQKFIVTTEISDTKKDIDKKFGIVVENSEKGVYNGMKKFLDNFDNIQKGYFDSKNKIEKFSPEEYNEKIIEKIKEILN